MIEPLVHGADEIRVFQKPSYAIQVPIPRHTVTCRGQYQLDLDHELVRGWERFWNAGSWRRGAVALRVAKETIDWSDIFLWTEYGGVWSSRKQITKGTPASAVKYCDTNAVGSSVVVCLSASNGIQWMDVWFDVHDCESMHQLAQATCRRFVRKIEQGKFPREIVYNVPEYRELI